MTELPKTFDPADIEARWYAHWEERGLFHPDRPGAEPWTIVNPPPNVTGSLHVGHALDNTLQDILTRHARLQGKDALWVVGTDHAGIATQMVVERQMAEAQDKRTNYSREAFVEKVWDWKRESGGQITQQLRRLGCSMDWANERFTMDEGFSKAVVKVFVDLYNQGLLYRDKRLVNWDPGLGTAISDLEVETHELRGGFWHFRYPFADGVTLPDGADHLVVATTRPETMLADMAVAVNAADERYQSVIGAFVIQPITGRRLSIIADDHADPELGSGVVKITPGHDFNDFEVGRRAGIEARDMLNMLDAKADVVQCGGVPDEFIGLHRFKKDGIPGAREAAVAWMKARGLLVPHIDKDGVEHDAEPRTIQTPMGDRSGVVIEPWLTDQWYVDAATLAKAPIEAVRDGRIEIVPKTWEKTFFNWMDNIQPWCVSRQLWWGHRIPAWYGPRKEKAGLVRTMRPLIQSGSNRAIFVAATPEEAMEKAKDYYGPNVLVYAASDEDDRESDRLIMAPVGTERVQLIRDPDVLDTWFSSALWPFATMGWPDDSIPSSQGEVMNTLGGRYPNDVLISGFDILFFWNARMMMQGMHFMGDVPFRKLYLHGLVRAADGQKMSKSKGNTVDPLGLIDKYGADALRFFMAAMESQGRDIKMDERRVEGYRNFATKLWNAARFCQANGIGASVSPDAPPATLAVNKWIVGETIRTVQAIDGALADLRFDAAANAIYQFVWSRFCDWHLELIKPLLGQADAPATGAEADETRAVAGWVLDQILVLLHPFMPFITEELWSKMGARDNELIVARWPVVDAHSIDVEAGREIDWVIDVIERIRSQRLETGFNPSDRIPLGLLAASDERINMLNRNSSMISRLARIVPSAVEVKKVNGNNHWNVETSGVFELVEVDQTGFVTAQFPVGDVTFLAFTQGFIDLDAERARLSKGIAAAAKERDSLAARLNNPSFVERAKPEAIDKARSDHADKSAEADRLSAALARLG